MRAPERSSSGTKYCSANFLQTQHAALSISRKMCQLEGQFCEKLRRSIDGALGQEGFF